MESTVDNYEERIKNTLYIYIYGEKNIVLVFVPRVDSDK